jgi:hypothetical protein
MKVTLIILSFFVLSLPVSAETEESPGSELYKTESNHDEEEKTIEESGSGDNAGHTFLHITFAYALPVAYFSLSFTLKECIYSQDREENPLVYINPCITSVSMFGAAGFFTGLVLGLILSHESGFLETFVYSTVTGFLAGCAGMLIGGIYAMLNYNKTVSNDLFYYGGPVLFLAVPVIDIIRLLSED